MTDRTYLDRPHEEGYFDVEGYRLYYRRFGEGPEVLLGVHGGPGMSHDYLLPLAAHASEEVSVYLYDQFGCGRSDDAPPGDFDRYTVEHYREELDAVRRAIGADGVHLYGQSWGGVLALEYVLAASEHVDSLVLANTFADLESAHESLRESLDHLSAEKRRVVEEHEADRDYEGTAYREALAEVDREHVCRIDPMPDPVRRSFENVNPDTRVLWGPNGYVVGETARLSGWDVRDRLGGIDVPTLVLTGAYDGIDPGIAEDMADRIPDAELVEFEASSHVPLWEEPDAHRDHLAAFLPGPG